jgi:hypothetical protein
MPDRTACKYCGKVGFVRRERVVKAERATTAFYCGSCNRSWEEAEEGRAADDVKRPPNNKRERS